MATTTIRVDTDTHAKLLEISTASGSSLVETVREAADILHRQRFAVNVAKELAALRDDPVAWNDYVAEAAKTCVSDGIGR